MADLTGTTPADTYKGLLQVNDYTDGISGNTGSNALAIQDGAGNATPLAISTDHVGIGTTSPSAKLEVEGVGRFNTPTGGALISSWTAGVSTGENQPVLVLRTNEINNADRIKLNSDGDSYFNGGNVGIGTTNPDSPLHVYNTAGKQLNLTRAINVIGISGGASAEIHGGALAVTSPSMGGAIGFTLKDSDGTGSGGNTEGVIYFKTKDSGAGLTEKMRIDSAGNVGIGITNPSNLLELKTASGSGDMADIALYSDGANNNATSSIFLGQSLTRRAEITAIRAGTGNSHALAFSTNGGAAAPEERLRIDSAGNVGIGTSSFGTSAIGVIGIGNATAPTSSPADMVQLYAEDVTASSELRVRDEAGNVTTLSPHAKDAPDSLYDNGKGVDEMHRVANHYLGTIVFTNVDRRNDLMQKQLNGEELPEDRTFKVTETFAEYNARTGADLQVEDWDANQQAMFDAQEEKVAARQAKIDAWDNEEEEAPEPLQSYVKKPKPDWLS